MSTPSPLVDAIIEGWKDYQQQLAVIARPLTSEQLASASRPSYARQARSPRTLSRAALSGFMECLKS